MNFGEFKVSIENGKLNISGSDTMANAIELSKFILKQAKKLTPIPTQTPMPNVAKTQPDANNTKVEVKPDPEPIRVEKHEQTNELGFVF